MTEQRIEPRFSNSPGAGGGHRQPRNTARAARQARRHRGFAVVMMVLLGVASMALVGMFVVRSGMLPETERQEPVVQQQAAVSKKSVKLLKPKITGFDRRAQSYVVTATSAKQDEDNPAVISLDKVIADLQLKKSGDVVKITADRGRYNNDDETLHLEGNVRIRSAKGYAADMMVADIFLKKGRVVSNKPVTVILPSGYVQANGVELWNDGENIRFLNRALFVLKPKKKGSG